VASAWHNERHQRARRGTDQASHTEQLRPKRDCDAQWTSKLHETSEYTARVAAAVVSRIDFEGVVQSERDWALEFDL
jgi:hypothetical protein